MSNRINDLFERKRESILSVYYTAGFPSLNNTMAIAKNLEEAGVDMIEIGIPFSDPVADGPIIQDSNRTALGNGMTVLQLLDQVRKIRTTVKLPIILMGYLNPVLQYGFESFCKDAAQAGADGLILPDMPLDEYEYQYKSSLDSSGLRHTFLISPATSQDRIRMIDEATNGFIYAVSASSTTGVKGKFSAEQEVYFNRLVAMKLKNPFLIGFGISDRQTFMDACTFGAGAIVGSAFISMLKDSHDLKNDTLDFISNLRG